MEPPRSSSANIRARGPLCAALAVLASCQQPQPRDDVQEPSTQPAPQGQVVPRLESLDRSAILSAVAQAASAHAAGTDDAAAQRALDGRQFELRIRFGCSGPSKALREQWLGWSLDQETGTLRVRAKPTLAGEDPLVQALGGNGFEAVEGFWIPRPWLLEATCPAASALEPAPAEEVAAGDAKISEPVQRGPRIGIAQFFSEMDARTRRRSMRPYEAVKILNAGVPMASQGFDLVLSGRLKAFSDKRVIVCTADDAHSPPDCIVSADFDRVRIEAPGTAEIIAEWSRG